jgi:tight adherence protein C
MVFIIYTCIILGLYLIVLGARGSEADKRLHAILPEATRKKLREEKVRSFFNPLFVVSRFIIERLRLEESLRRNLATAHLKLLPEEFFTLKFVLMIFLYALTFFVFGKANLLKGSISLILGFLLPDLWLRRIVAKRKQAIARILPETVDLIGLCIEAGLDFTMAVKWIVEKTQFNPFSEELAFVWEEIRWGKPHSQALKDMSRRLNIPEVSSFVRAIIQAERMGTPVSEAFSIISEDTRLQRFEKGERIALKAPIKILFPLLFFILPVIGIIIMGPVFMQFLGQKGVITEAFK